MLSLTRFRPNRSLLKTTFVLSLLAFFLIVAQSALAFPGYPDTDFGGGAGYVHFAPYNQDAYFCGVGTAFGEKILVGGSADGDFFVRRLLSDGSVDDSYGNDGLGILANEDESYYATDFIVLPAGDILMIGQTAFGDRGVLGYLDSDGQKNYSFGTPPYGRVLLDCFGTDSNHPTGLTVHGSDIYISGSGDRDRNAFMVARFDELGNLQQSFGDSGVATAGFGNGRAAICMDTGVSITGNVIAVGEVKGYDDVWGMGIACFDRNGALKSSFGLNGVLDLAGDLGEGCLYSVKILSDSSIVATGTLGNDLVVVKFTPDGFLDTDFGWQGVARADLGGTVNRFVGTHLAVQESGKIVVVGNHTRETDDLKMAVVARFTSDGILDLLFGDHGYLMTSFGGYGNAETTGLALQEDGDILMAAVSDNWRTPDHDMVVERIQGGDETLGSGGCSSVPLPALGLLLLPALALVRR